MLVHFENSIHFATRLKTHGWALQLIYPDSKFDVQLGENITVVNNIGNRVETKVGPEYTEMDLLRFIINHGGYIATEYNTIIKDPIRTEEHVYKIAMDINLWRTAMYLDDVWKPEWDDMYNEGFLLNDHPEYSGIPKSAYIAGKIKRQIGHIETEMRRHERTRWERWIRHTNRNI